MRHVILGFSGEGPTEAISVVLGDWYGFSLLASLSSTDCLMPTTHSPYTATGALM